MASDSLTITITGPQGCGKTLVAEWIARNLPRQIREPYQREGKVLAGVVVVDGEGIERHETRL